MKAFAKRFALVFALWTIAAICGGLADYLLAELLGRHPAFWAVFQRPLTEQWIWAALTPLVLFVAHRFPLARPALARAIVVHVAAFLLLSLLHCVVAGAVGGPLLAVPAHYPGSLLKLRFLEEIYGDIWMYWPLVCIQALIDSHARAREREERAASWRRCWPPPVWRCCERRFSRISSSTPCTPCRRWCALTPAPPRT